MDSLFFYLSKIFDFVINPLFIVFLLLVIAIFSKKNKKLWVLVAVILLYIFSNPFLVTNVGRFWEIPKIHYLIALMR